MEIKNANVVNECGQKNVGNRTVNVSNWEQFEIKNAVFKISLFFFIHVYCFLRAFSIATYLESLMLEYLLVPNDQRTNGPVNAHLISSPSKAQNIQNLENIW